eukprot:2811927-Rhodomonas_salina.2
MGDAGRGRAGEIGELVAAAKAYQAASAEEREGMGLEGTTQTKRRRQRVGKYLLALGGRCAPASLSPRSACVLCLLWVRARMWVEKKRSREHGARVCGDARAGAERVCARQAGVDAGGAARDQDNALDRGQPQPHGPCGRLRRLRRRVRVRVCLCVRVCSSATRTRRFVCVRVCWRVCTAQRDRPCRRALSSLPSSLPCALAHTPHARLFFHPLTLACSSQQVATMTQMRMRHGSATVGGRVYVVGGKDQGGHALASMERCLPALTPAVWG